MVVGQVFDCLFRFENWRWWVRGGSIFGDEAGVIDVNSVEAEGDMSIPGVWIYFDEAGVDRFTEINIDFIFLILTSRKHSASINIALIFSAL